jgi:hypothetical protein
VNEGYRGINLTRIYVVCITDYYTIKRIVEIHLDVMTRDYICAMEYWCFAVGVCDCVAIAKIREQLQSSNELLCMMLIDTQTCDK